MAEFLFGVKGFVLMLGLDYAWGRYTRALNGRPVAAANWAVFLFVVGATVTQGYMERPWTIYPAAAGAWLGTWLSSRKANDVEAE